MNRDMPDWNKHFHTSVRPHDMNGGPLQPLDLVVLSEIPEHFWIEPGFEGLKDYAGKFGMVTYLTDGPYYFDMKGYPGWASPTGELVHVIATKIRDDCVYRYEFALPPSTVRRIPYNSIIMSLFADYPWQMPDDEGPSDHPFVIRGMEQFAFIERVLSTPYDELEKAHRAAVQFLAPEI